MEIQPWHLPTSRELDQLGGKAGELYEKKYDGVTVSMEREGELLAVEASNSERTVFSLRVDMDKISVFAQYLRADYTTGGRLMNISLDAAMMVLLMKEGDLVLPDEATEDISDLWGAGLDLVYRLTFNGEEPVMVRVLLDSGEVADCEEIEQTINPFGFVASNYTRKFLGETDITGLSFEVSAGGEFVTIVFKDQRGQEKIIQVRMDFDRKLIPARGNIDLLKLDKIMNGAFPDYGEVL